MKTTISIEIPARAYPAKRKEDSATPEAVAKFERGYIHHQLENLNAAREEIDRQAASLTQTIYLLDRILEPTKQPAEIAP